MKVILVIVMIALMEVKGTVRFEKPATNTKAASPYQNINCQCDSLTFRDEYGNLHGNCNSVDKSGAQWCYLPEYGYDSCNDGNSYDFQSKRFPGRKWSYEACATPAPYYSPGSGSGNSDCVARYGANSPICTPGYNNNNNNNGGCSGPRCNSGYHTGSGSGYNTGSGSGYNSGSGCTGGRCSGSGSGYNTGSSSCSGGRCSGSGSGYNTGSNNGFSGNLGSILGGSQGSGGSNPRTSSNTKDSSRVNFGR